MKQKILLAVLIVGAAISVSAETQTKTIVLKSSEGVVTRGSEDPNIKHGAKLNDLNNPAKFVRKNNVTRGGAPVIELKANQGNSADADANIKQDEVLNDKSNLQRKP